MSDVIERLCIAHSTDGWPAVYVAADHVSFSRSVKVYEPSRKGSAWIKPAYEAKLECANWIHGIRRRGVGPRIERLRHRVEEHGGAR